MSLKLLQCLTIACWLGFQMDGGTFNTDYILGSQTLRMKPTKPRVLPCTPALLHPCPPTPTLLAQSATCPADLETLTSLMLRDLPNYANRVIQRSRPVNEDIDIDLYIIVAGRAEFQPLTLGPGSYNSVTTANVEPPQQVFFTTLERQYVQGGVIERESFHWLFLTNTDSGWRLALMFTRLGSPSPERPPTPPRESSNGIMGRAVQLWLRDCRADAIRASYR